MDFASVVKDCLAYVGGIGVIIFAIIKFLSKSIDYRLSAKYNNKLEQKLETHKTYLNKKEYVSKVRFDAEFEIYRNLNREFSMAVKGVSIMVPQGIAFVPVNEKEKKEYEFKNYVDANNYVVNAQDVLYANSAFIPEELYAKYHEILLLCHKQLGSYQLRNSASFHGEHSFTDDDYERTGIIMDKWLNVNKSVREYLFSLDVIGSDF